MQIVFFYNIPIFLSLQDENWNSGLEENLDLFKSFSHSWKGWKLVCCMQTILCKTWAHKFWRDGIFCVCRCGVSVYFRWFYGSILGGIFGSPWNKELGLSCCTWNYQIDWEGSAKFDVFFNCGLTPCGPAASIKDSSAVTLSFYSPFT